MKAKSFKNFIKKQLIVFFILVFGTMFFVYSNYDEVISPQILAEIQKTNPQTQVCGVVFGAAVWSHNRPSHALRDRLNMGATLYEQGKVNCLILSGGGAQSLSHDEVSVMKKIALAKKVKLEDLIFDSKGINTLATIKNLPKNVDHFVFISNDFHLARIKLLASKYGVKSFDVQAATYLNGRYQKEFYFFLREVAGIFWYFKFEWLGFYLFLNFLLFLKKRIRSKKNLKKF